MRLKTAYFFYYFIGLALFPFLNATSFAFAGTVQDTLVKSRNNPELNRIQGVSFSKGFTIFDDNTFFVADATHLNSQVAVIRIQQDFDLQKSTLAHTTAANSAKKQKTNEIKAEGYTVKQTNMLTLFSQVPPPAKTLLQSLKNVCAALQNQRELSEKDTRIVVSTTIYRVTYIFQKTANKQRAFNDAESFSVLYLKVVKVRPPPTA